MRSLRLACAALVATATLAGCANDSVPEAPPTPSPSPSALPISVPAGADGLDVRYLDKDGQVKTLRVKDFPR